MSQIPEHCHWVARRAECTTRQMFRRLADIVRADVDAANALQQPSTEYQFEEVTSTKFLVTRRVTHGFVATGSVRFEIFGAEIIATRIQATDDQRELLRTRARLDEAGRCMFRVGGDDRYAWEVSRRALEGLIFEAPDA